MQRCNKNMRPLSNLRRIKSSRSTGRKEGRKSAKLSELFSLLPKTRSTLWTWRLDLKNMKAKVLEMAMAGWMIKSKTVYYTRSHQALELQQARRS